MPNFKWTMQKTFAVLALALLAGAAYSYASKTRILRPAIQYSINTGAYIPVGNALKAIPISSQVRDAQSRGHGNRTPLLNEVIRLAPRYYPPRARVLDAGCDGYNCEVNLNSAFSNLRFWRGRKRRHSVIAFHALARNIAFMNLPKGVALPVQFVIEGKRVARIGAFNASQPLPPDKIIK